MNCGHRFANVSRQFTLGDPDGADPCRQALCSLAAGITLLGTLAQAVRFECIADQGVAGSAGPHEILRVNVALDPVNMVDHDGPWVSGSATAHAADTQAWRPVLGLVGPVAFGSIGYQLNMFERSSRPGRTGNALSFCHADSIANRWSGREAAMATVNIFTLWRYSVPQSEAMSNLERNFCG